MLRASLEQEHQRGKWRDYVAQNLWAVGSLLSRGKYPFPSWMEMNGDGGTEPSGEDIYNALLTRWGGG